MHSCECMDQMAYFDEICLVVILCLLMMKYSIPTVSIMIRINPTIAPITMPANALPERPSEVLLSLVSSPVHKQIIYILLKLTVCYSNRAVIYLDILL